MRGGKDDVANVEVKKKQLKKGEREREERKLKKERRKEKGVCGEGRMLGAVKEGGRDGGIDRKSVV